MSKKARHFQVDTQRLLDRPLSIAMLLNSKLSAHARIMRGFSDYMREFKLNWSIVLNHELQHRKGDEVDLWFDGIVADYNHQQHQNLLESLETPVVALLSGLDQQVAQFNHPIICLDNHKMMSMAYEFLAAKGLQSIACYGLEDDDDSNWQASRLQSYLELQKNDNAKPLIYQGAKASFSSWMEELEALSFWLEGLAKPCGVIVTSDVRARTLISACEMNQIIVPDEISIVSIGDIEPSELFHSISLSVVDPNYYMMGRLCADKLAKQLAGKEVPTVTYSQPEFVDEGTSTDFRSVVDPHVLKALHFVRGHYNKGIKVQQVVDYSGCSRTTLESKFKSQIGHSLHAEIHKLKLDQAQSLLEKTDLNISEIAKLSGIPSSQYLYGLFQKELGLTPTEFRQQAQLLE